MDNKSTKKELDHPEIVYLKSIDNSLVIEPSRMMSLYCYSILRLDPYRGCAHKCSYCYTRYFCNSTSAPRAIINYPELLERFMSKFIKQGIKLPPFRLSALTDPFQPIEEKLKICYKVLRLCLQSKMHVIISTKSDLIIKSPWIDIVKELADKGLVIVQFTVTSFGKIARYLEPNAPPPDRRLKAIELLISEDIPVILRLQPIIPFINDNIDFLEEYVDIAKSLGVKLIITETYRFLSWNELKVFEKFLGSVSFKQLTNKSLWECYPNSPFKRPKLNWRKRLYLMIREFCARKGVGFSVCRDELYYLRTTPDCCGIFLMRNYILRKTLNEYLHKVSVPILEKEDILKYPSSQFRRKLLQHYEYIEKYISYRFRRVSTENVT